MVNFDITEPVVSDLVYGAAAGATVNAPESTAWDCAIGDLKFLFAISKDTPFQRQTADFRRQRIDTERDPGEQSLDSGFWLRSQASWHQGSGLSTAEPLEVPDTEARFRYHRGGGVDPWTPGQLTLLNATEQVHAGTNDNQTILGVQDGVLHVDGTSVNWTNYLGYSPVVWGGSGTITSITSDGESYYAADNVGIYSGVLPSGDGTKVWDTGADTLVRWVKSRLMAAVGDTLYELVGTGPALPTPLYTHPNNNWVWTDIAEGPQAIYVAGYSGDSSAIYKINVTVDASTVTLSQPVVVTEMPRGERVLSLYTVLGAYLIVGTSAGARVAAISDDGGIVVGPLVVQTTDGVMDAVAVNSDVYVTVGSFGSAGNRESRPGLYRINLSKPLEASPLAFPVAADVYATTTGMAESVTLANGLLYFSVSGANGGVYWRNPDTFVAEGWLETGRIRMGTVESKSWRDLRLLTKSVAGTVTEGNASTDDADAPVNWNTVIIADEGHPDTSGKLTSVTAEPRPNLYVALHLKANDAFDKSPIVVGYQLRAMPAPQRARLLSVPVMVFDFQTDKTGVRIGHQGYAWDVISKLQNLEDDAAVVQWRDYTTGEAATAYVERVTFTRSTPPSARSDGAGGVAEVILRLV